jgi:hypothetical protein
MNPGLNDFDRSIQMRVNESVYEARSATRVFNRVDLSGKPEVTKIVVAWAAIERSQDRTLICPVCTNKSREWIGKVESRFRLKVFIVGETNVTDIRLELLSAEKVPKSFLNVHRFAASPCSGVDLQSRS